MQSTESENSEIAPMGGVAELLVESEGRKGCEAFETMFREVYDSLGSLTLRYESFSKEGTRVVL
jgi:hypothetical protein